MKKKVMEDLIIFNKAGVAFYYDEKEHPEHLVIEYYDFPEK